MQCPETVERLPELLNGTLTGLERAGVEAHVAGCPACSREWNETRLGAAVFESHVPSSVITALAWDRPVADFDLDVARRHIGACPECTEDLALARESRARETTHATTTLTKAAPRRSWIAPAGLAAVFAAVAFLMGLTLGSRRAQQGLVRAELARREAVENASRLHTEAARLREMEASLRDRLARLAAPRLNLPVIELLPGSFRTRDSSSHEPELRVRAEDELAALVLSAPPSRQPVAAELRDERDNVLWKGTGLRPSALGGYVIGIPTQLLPEGRASIVLLPENGGPPLATLPFRVRKPR